MSFLIGQPEIAGQDYGRAFRDYMNFLSPWENEEILSRTVLRVWHFVLRNASAMDRRQVATAEKIE